MSIEITSRRVIVTELAIQLGKKKKINRSISMMPELNISQGLFFWLLLAVVVLCRPAPTLSKETTLELLEWGKMIFIIHIRAFKNVHADLQLSCT